jgi:hypothetical protein
MSDLGRKTEYAGNKAAESSEQVNKWTYNLKSARIEAAKAAEAQKVYQKAVAETLPTSRTYVVALDDINKGFQETITQLKNGEIIFPLEFKNTAELKETMHEYHMATPQGLKSKHDDAVDATSRLINIVPQKPGIMSIEDVQPSVPTMWDTAKPPEPTALSSYIV